MVYYNQLSTNETIEKEKKIQHLFIKDINLENYQIDSLEVNFSRSHFYKI